MKKSILKKLKAEAEDHEPTFRVRIVAAIVHKGKIVAIGKNQNKTHPVAALYSKHEEAIYLHAEVDAINKAKKKLKDLSKAEMYIMRMKQDGSLGLSAPCKGCSKCIEAYGLKKVTYTTNEGLTECM